MIPNVTKWAFYILLFIMVLLAALSLVFLLASVSGTNMEGIGGILKWIAGQP